MISAAMLGTADSGGGLEQVLRILRPPLNSVGASTGVSFEVTGSPKMKLYESFILEFDVFSPTGVNSSVNTSIIGSLSTTEDNDVYIRTNRIYVRCNGTARLTTLPTLTDKWTTIKVVYDTSIDNFLRFYADGALIDTSSSFTPATPSQDAPYLFTTQNTNFTFENPFIGFKFANIKFIQDGDNILDLPFNGSIANNGTATVTNSDTEGLDYEFVDRE